MLTSSKLQFYSLFSILYSLFFTLPVNAVAPADQVPEHKAPYYAFPITSLKPTADQYDYPSKMGDKFLLGAFVEHIDEGTLFGQLMGDKDFRDEVNRFGRGNTINLIPRRTISFDADQEIYDLLKSGDGDDLTIVTGLADYISVLSKNQDSNPSLFISTCLYLGLESPRECAKALNMTFNNPEAPEGVSVNKLSTSNWYQMLTPIKLQTGNGPTGLFKNAQDTKRTREVGSGNVMHSGNMNCVTQNCATSNLDFADSVLDAIPSGGVTADQIAAKQLFKYMGHQRTTSENFFILFRPNPKNLNPIEKLAYKIGLFEPVIVRGFIPGLPQLAEMIKFKAKMMSTLRNVERIDSLFGKVRDGVPKGATIEKKLENLVIDEVGYNCGEVVAPLQIRGPSSTTNSDGGLGLEFNFTVLEPNFPEEIPDMPVYCAELIGPRELKAIEALFSWAPDALTRKYYPLAYEGNFTYETKNLTRIPQPVIDQKNVKTKPKDVNCQQTGEMVVCGPPNTDGSFPMCPATTCDQVTVAYSKGTNASLPTGVVENLIANLNFMALMPLDPERGLNWDDACYEKQTTSRFDANPAKQSLIAAVGGGLATIMGRENLGVVEGFTCGKVYTRAKKVLASPSMCSGTMGKPLTPANGDCLLGSTGNFNVPPMMKTILESAAQEYSVPAGVIMGILFAEGGFERTQYYGEWSDETVCALEIPKCREGNINQTSGATGPFQLIPGWFPESEYGSSCNFTDAARAVASALAKGKPGNPCWISGNDEGVCAEVHEKYPEFQDVIQSGSKYICEIDSTINVTIGGTLPSSCSSWSDTDVVTAARAFRGMCDPVYFDRVLSTWKL